jgi:hypothetical protein
MEIRRVFSERRLLFCSDVGLDRGFGGGVGGVSEGSGNVVLVPAHTLICISLLIFGHDVVFLKTPKHGA